MASPPTHEHARLEDDRLAKVNWRKWGTYVSLRQWGTVREDYSADGDAWNYLPHDHARSRAYRWGEDAIAGWCDNLQSLCLGISLWNGKDPILKERLFGLTNTEGNHGEDVKEVWEHMEALPSGAYAKFRYRYPQCEFPYAQLVEENRKRGREQDEYELTDTNAFAEQRYFDVFVEYAKEDADSVVMRIEALNCGPDAADLWLIPQAWLRNTWSWDEGAPRPRLRSTAGGVAVSHENLPAITIQCEPNTELLFCENETNAVRHWGEARGARTFKDGFHDTIIKSNHDATVLDEGSKCAFVRRTRLPSGGKSVMFVRLALTKNSQHALSLPACEAVVSKRRTECDEFWRHISKGCTDPDEMLVQRRAGAGLLWSRQYYRYDVARWLEGDPTQPAPPPQRRHGRNSHWQHFDAECILSMPDKWEYPWHAAWDLAFHCIALAHIDVEDAKRQLVWLSGERSMHASGAMPAYEWTFSDVNPPVHAWAAHKVFTIEEQQKGVGDNRFLRQVFLRLLINFTWWVNRKDEFGHNIFDGGFLGLDNIGVFDRSAPLPDGITLRQADATSWMAMYALNMMRIAITLGQNDDVYEDIASKFFEHFLQIAAAMADMGGTGDGLWDETDGAYYDQLRMPDGSTVPLRIPSIVGLIPLFAVEVLEPEQLHNMPHFQARVEDYLARHPKAASLVSRWQEPGRGERRLFSVLRGHRMKRLLRRALDEQWFLSNFGIRSMSRTLEDQPFVLTANGHSWSVKYEPGESRTDSFGGNSNWRGPVWFPFNFLFVESLLRFHRYYGDDFLVECPVGSGQMISLEGAANLVAERLRSLFTPDSTGSRPCMGANSTVMSDPRFRELVLFHEYFHGDTGKGCGAQAQTGWTALVATIGNLRWVVK
ncbi:MAG: glucosidase [Phycisphaerales bacterium]|nr:glucosidase [Phycisphaerales bacterium]